MSNNRLDNRTKLSYRTISGSGRKPWRQKGTGRARAGSFRSCIWRSGVKSFLSSRRLYKKKINKKVYKSALNCIFSILYRQNRVIILDDSLFNSLNFYKSSFFFKFLENNDLNNKKLYI